MSKWFCCFCLAEGKPDEFEIDVPKSAESPKCPVHEDDYLIPHAEPCCTAEGREILRDDLGQFDDSGDAYGPSWVCTGCGERTTW